MASEPSFEVSRLTTAISNTMYRYKVRSYGWLLDAEQSDGQAVQHVLKVNIRKLPLDAIRTKHNIYISKRDQIKTSLSTVQVHLS